MKTIITTLLLILLSVCSCVGHKEMAEWKLRITDSSFSTSQVDTAVSVLKKRLGREGITNPEIKTGADKSLTIRCEQLSKTFVQHQLLKPGAIDCYEVYSMQEISNSLDLADRKLFQMYVAPAHDQVFDAIHDRVGGAQTVLGVLINFAPQGLGNSASSYLGVADLADTASISRLLILAKDLLPFDCEFYFGTPEKIKTPKTVERQIVRLYGVKKYSHMSLSRYLEIARQDYDENSQPLLRLNLNQAGALRWAGFTEKNLGKAVALIVDGLVLTCPVVQGVMNDGNIQIAGNFTVEYASELADNLSSGYLALHLVVADYKILK